MTVSTHRLEPGPSGLAYRAYTYLADRVISGSLAEGAYLTEAEIADALGMSRTPVREAFLTAETYGLLRLLPKKGAIVTTVTAADLDTLMGARIMLETEAVRLIARSSGGGGLGPALAEILDAQAAAAASKDVRTFADADYRFHARIVAESGNAIIEGFYRQLGPRLQRFVHQVAARDVDVLDRIVEEHERLLSLTSDQDSHDDFEVALREHVSDNRR